MWGETFNDFESDESDLSLSKKEMIKEPSCGDFTFPNLPLGIQVNFAGQDFEHFLFQSVDFMKTHFGSTAGKSMQFRKGTTTLAFVYEPATQNDKGGIIVAVDSRASSGEYICELKNVNFFQLNFSASKSVMKILDIGDRMVATMAGGAADCQFWTRIVAKYCT